jgi:hypothetical protein
MHCNIFSEFMNFVEQSSTGAAWCRLHVSQQVVMARCQYAKYFLASSILTNFWASSKIVV